MVGAIALAPCRVKPVAFVGHVSATLPPLETMLNCGRDGVVTSAHVKPTRASSVTNLLGLEVLPPDRKKKRSIWARSAPPLPTDAMIGVGGAFEPNVELSGFNHRSQISSVPSPPTNV